VVAPYAIARASVGRISADGDAGVPRGGAVVQAAAKRARQQSHT